MPSSRSDGKRLIADRMLGIGGRIERRAVEAVNVLFRSNAPEADPTSSALLLAAIRLSRDAEAESIPLSGSGTWQTTGEAAWEVLVRWGTSPSSSSPEDDETE